MGFTMDEKRYISLACHGHWEFIPHDQIILTSKPKQQSYLSRTIFTILDQALHLSLRSPDIMTTIARPSTPFPHTHALTHSRYESTYHSLTSPTGYFSSRPLHFSMRPLPTPTPPSLLNRTPSTGSNHASSSSSSALTASPRTPALVNSHMRRESTVSIASVESTPLPTTPHHLEEESPSAPYPTPFELPSPLYSNKGKALELPPPEYNWTHKEITDQTLFNVSYSPLDLCPMTTSNTNTSPSPASPVRPKFKRRDTPRPQTTTLSSLGMTDGIQRDEDGHRGKRRLTSVVDGGAWVVLEE